MRGVAGGGFFEAKESPSRTHPKKAVLERADLFNRLVCQWDAEDGGDCRKNFLLKKKGPSAST